LSRGGVITKELRNIVLKILVFWLIRYLLFYFNFIVKNLLCWIYLGA